MILILLRASLRSDLLNAIYISGYRIRTSEFLKKATLFLVLVVLVMFTICLDSLIAESLTKERVLAI